MSDLRSGALPRPRDGVLGARNEWMKHDWESGIRNSWECHMSPSLPTLILASSAALLLLPALILTFL